MIIKIKKSRKLEFFWLVAVSASALPIGLSQLPLFVKILLWLLLVVYGRHVFQSLAYAGATLPVTALQLDKQGRCRLHVGTTEYVARVANQWCIGNWCLLYLDQLPGQPRQRVVLAPDTLTTRERAYLQRWLSGYEG